MLTETYRPKCWDEVCGQEKVIGKLRALSARGGLAGRAYWLSGGSGQGKTSIGRLIAADVACEETTFSVDADTLTVSRLESLVERAYPGRSLFGGWCILVNEAHGLSGTLIRRLNEMIEPPQLPAWVTWVFTTTVAGQEGLFGRTEDPAPLLSRCFPLNLAQRDLCEPFAARLVWCARDAGLLNGHPDSHYLAQAKRILKEERNNLRAAMQRVEAGELA